MGKRSRHFRFTKKRSIEDIERDAVRAQATSMLRDLETIKMIKESTNGQADHSR